jgi:lipopolysaccharide/colanic/teichoic acid biosynthesis glycosyltransferase
MELFSKTVAAIMLIILSPLLLLISAGSLFFQRFPILFKQERVGYKFQTFFLYKFRTMKINNVNQLVTEAGDKRITQWGKILRILKFDELPQLWNIVRGDMRFIGPRPEVQEYVKGNDFSFLEKIKPGLTDFSSILLRNETNILLRAGGVDKYTKLLEVKVKLGHLYADQKNFWLDMKLVLLTLVSIILPKTAILLVKKLFIKKYKPELIPVINEWLD